MIIFNVVIIIFSFFFTLWFAHAYTCLISFLLHLEKLIWYLKKKTIKQWVFKCSCQLKIMNITFSTVSCLFLAWSQNMSEIMATVILSLCCRKHLYKEGTYQIFCFRFVEDLSNLFLLFFFFLRPFKNPSLNGRKGN